MSLSSLPGALHCAGDSVGGDLRTWWGEVLNEVQVTFLNLILVRIHIRAECRVLTPRTHNILRSAFGESIELYVKQYSLNYTTGSIGQRCKFISMILCAILHYCQTTRSWNDVYHPPFARCLVPRSLSPLYNLASQNSGLSTNFKILRWNRIGLLGSLSRPCAGR